MTGVRPRRFSAAGPESLELAQLMEFQRFGYVCARPRLCRTAPDAAPRCAPIQGRIRHTPALPKNFPANNGKKKTHGKNRFLPIPLKRPSNARKSHLP